MGVAPSVVLLTTCVLVFSALYYMFTLQSNDLGLRGSDKLQTVSNCIYESVMVSTFGPPLSAPAGGAAVMMVVAHRAVVAVLALALLSRPRRVVATT